MPQRLASTRLLAALGSEKVLECECTENVDLLVDTDFIGWVVLNSKRKSANLMNKSFLADFMHILKNRVQPLIERKSIRVIVVCSEKNTFHAGSDLDMLFPITRVEDAVEVSKSMHRFFRTVEALKVPTVAALEGSCLGCGLELAISCSYRVAARKPLLIIGLPETVKLPMLIGLQAALKLILPGATVGVEKAKAVGLIDVILEHEDRYKDEYRFLNQVRKFAASCIDQQPFHILRAHVKLPVMDRLLANKIGYRLLANTAKLQLDKRTRGEFLAPYTALDSVMFACSTSDIQRALDYEAHNFGKSCTSAESKHLIFVFLMQQEAKRLQNRFTRAPLPIHNVAILGAGLVGSSIAHWILHKTKAMVLLHDPDENQLRQSQERVAQLLKWQLSKTRPNRLTFATIMGSSTAQVAAIEEPILEEITPIMERIVVSTEYNDIAHVQCVLFSCMHEKLEPAVRVLQASESCVSDETIIAIHSNTFSIDTLARYARRPQRVVGLHFFMPVWRVQLVEIVRGRETSEQTLATAYQFSLSLGKIPIVVNNGPGYVLNRILGVYVLEAARLLVEGATVSIVDAALFNFGMTMGPFRLLDEIGIDIVQQLSIALEPLGKQFSKEGVLHILHNMVEGGYLGRKVNKGFYRYKRGKVMGVEPTLDQVLPGYHLNTNNVVTGQNHAIGNETRRTSILLRNHQDYNTDNHNNWDTQVIVDRCIMLMINEGVRVLEDGVAESPSDIDLAMLFGAGFAPFRGGMLAYADQLGCAAIVKRMQHLQHLCNGAERFKPASLLIRMAQSNKQFFPLRPYPTPLPQSKL